MDADSQRQRTATAAAEEILRIIYGDDLEGCTVSLDRITEVILTAMAGQAECDRAVAELNDKAYEAIRLLSTPPADGPSLNADELRSLLGELAGQDSKPGHESDRRHQRAGIADKVPGIG